MTSIIIITRSKIISDTFFAIKDAYNASISSDNSAISSSLSFKSDTVPSLPSLNMNIGSGTFSISPLKYIVPRSLYPILNVEDVPGVERTWIESSGPGEFNLGQKWLENVYTAYDSEYFGFSRSFPFLFFYFVHELIC